MTGQAYGGLFVAEGSSDMPLAQIVERMFFDRGVVVRLSTPDFGRLGRVAKDVLSRLKAGEQLSDHAIDFVVVHRDADNVGPGPRRKEIRDAVDSLVSKPLCVPVIPVRMTEAWLLLDEAAIRFVAGNPRGRTPLGLPKLKEIEDRADPKQILATALLQAANVTGRKREALAKRFAQHRRQLLERLDPVGRLLSYQAGNNSWRISKHSPKDGLPTWTDLKGSPPQGASKSVRIFRPGETGRTSPSLIRSTPRAQAIQPSGLLHSN